MMQQYQIFSQRQTDTRPYGMEFTILPFIESLEHMIQFLFGINSPGLFTLNLKSSFPHHEPATPQ